MKMKVPDKPKDMHWDEWQIVRMELLVGRLFDILAPARPAVEVIEAQVRAWAERASAPRQTQIIGALDHLIGVVSAIDEDIRHLSQQIEGLRQEMSNSAGNNANKEQA